MYIEIADCVELLGSRSGFFKSKFLAFSATAYREILKNTLTQKFFGCTCNFEWYKLFKSFHRLFTIYSADFFGILNNCSDFIKD